jgi:cytochrome o ubiquinol oxidase subunit 1
VSDEEAYWSLKGKALEEKRLSARPEKYEPIEMPRNSPTGFVTAFFTTVLGFAAVWHIWWLVILGVLGAWATFTLFAWRDHHEFEVPADEVERLDNERRAAKAKLLGVPSEVTA